MYVFPYLYCFIFRFYILKFSKDKYLNESDYDFCPSRVAWGEADSDRLLLGAVDSDRQFYTADRNPAHLGEVDSNRLFFKKRNGIRFTHGGMESAAPENHSRTAIS